MRNLLCWNCRSDQEPVHSAVTDMSYCSSCGAIMVGRRARAVHGAPDVEQVEASGDGEGGQDRS